MVVVGARRRGCGRRGGHGRRRGGEGGIGRRQRGERWFGCEWFWRGQIRRNSLRQVRLGGSKGRQIRLRALEQRAVLSPSSLPFLLHLDRILLRRQHRLRFRLQMRWKSPGHGGPRGGYWRTRNADVVHALGQFARGRRGERRGDCGDHVWCRGRTGHFLSIQSSQRRF
ncbi:hypothetical protein C8R47DRAFT_1087646 [Mycena vitilis]|nr:hypothetical protein C8R47DRAFT_1087646 [Mycena vitilis]